MYIPTFFAAHELVPETVYMYRGDRSWELLDDRLLITLDALREQFGPITVNNYMWGGDREWAGLRTANSPYGTEYSQHRFGRAADCIFTKNSVDTVRDYILGHPDAFPYINSVELETSWLHFDVRNCDRILTYKP